MKVPLSWLKEYIPTQLSPEDIAETLTEVGLEVEGMHEGVLEISLTPNLAHCASIRGIARELAAITQEQIHTAKYSLVEAGAESIEQKTSVVVENSDLCPRYSCRLITGLKVAPSPEWLKERIEQCGMRSVNNIVDITNLVLLELGHPLHAFDFDRLDGKKVVVRRAKKGEKIVTLDGQEHFPTEETLLICDAQKPVAIAGLMGSANSEVREETTTILLESAYFDPSSIRRASKRMGIHSEASYRFERGTDPNGVIEALERATSLICEIAGGRAFHGTIDVKKQHEFPCLEASCRLSRINRLLGTHLAMGEVETIFKRLHFSITKAHDDLIAVKIPTYRHDIHHEIDLIEEVARLYGYDNLHTRERALYRHGSLPHSPEFIFSKEVRCRLIAEGLQEFLTCDLISPQQAALISPDIFPTRVLIKLLNPQSVEQSVMRPSMLPGMLSVLKYNADHAIHTVAGFEVGRVHFTWKDRFYEPAALAVVLTGQKDPAYWENKSQETDFFELKGILSNLFDSLKIPSFTCTASHYSNFHPGRQASIFLEGIEVGVMGEVHPGTLKKAGLNQAVYFAELNLEELQRFVRGEIKMQPLPQYPSSDRDWTVTLPESFEVGAILQKIEENKSDLLDSFSLLDLYRSEKLGSDKKNATFRFVYRDKNKTISLQTVENEHLRMTNTISELLK